MDKSKVYFRSFFDHLIGPALCPLCVQPSTGMICPGCHRDLPWLENPCCQCGEPLTPAESASDRCGHCLSSPPAFTRTLAPLRYDFPVNHLVRAIKDHGDVGLLYLARELFADRCGAAVRDEPPELLVPVPLHPRRYRQRGYNQSQEWARLLGRTLGIAVACNGCERVLDTPHQQGLNARERRRNLRRAFRVKEGFRARHIALVDDVITTGTTLDLLARQFQARGVERVDAWCLARTPGGGR